MGLTIVAVAVMRVPSLAAGLSPDEAGFLLVGGQWSPGTSLYGDYWVDRPPVLVAIFGAADHLGGAVALRLLGLVAIAITIALIAATAGRLAGRVAAGWAAVTAGALLANPWLGVDHVNGELLAAPWTALGCYAAVRALEPDRIDPRWGWLSGAAVAMSVFTKQNLVDALVFAVVYAVVAVVRREIGPRDAAAVLVRVGGGLITLTAIVVALAALRGTGPSDLFDALFPFRVHAADVIASHHPDPGARAEGLLQRAVGAGLVALVMVVVWAAALRSSYRSASIAIAATVGYALVSIVVGGSFWSHYLIELVVPLAMGVGLFAAGSRRVAPAVVAYAAAACVVGVLVSWTRPAPDPMIVAGEAIGAVARPGDTVVNAWGRPELVRASGLASPYENLWSLPVKTNDPDLVQFQRVVGGADAPTWLVMRDSLGSWGLDSASAERLVERRYREVARVCGRGVWLRRDLDRATPADTPACAPPVSARR